VRKGSTKKPCSSQVEKEKPSGRGIVVQNRFKKGVQASKILASKDRHRGRESGKGREDNLLLFLGERKIRPIIVT